jgi:DNA modification methylase
MSEFTIHQGDALLVLRTLPEASVNCCVTSPPYWGLRDYGVEGQLGLEKTPEKYTARLVEILREVRRVLRDDGTLWLNLGDSYNAQPGQRKTTDKAGPKQVTDIGSIGAASRSVGGLKPKDLIGIPWRVAFALQADGWWLRSDIIWSKPNPMPESVTDRPTKAHEYLFLLTKSADYYYDHYAIKELASDTGRVNGRDGREEENGARPPGSNPRTLKRLDYSKTGRNKRSVWTVGSEPYSEAHFATFPTALIDPCVMAGCPEGGTVLDPFTGSGTTGVVALNRRRKFIGIELNPEYCGMARRRISEAEAPLFNTDLTEVTA